MTPFSNDQMYRPLFEEPTVDIERDHPLDSPFGFLIGGMANISYSQLGQQYFDAAILLTERVEQGDVEDYRLANPVLFLFRHSVELFLKAAMGDSEKTHNLDVLAHRFEAFIEHEFDAIVPEWIVLRIKELASIDPSSTSFRYGETYDKAAQTTVPISGEFHVDLQHFRSGMLALNSALVGVVAAVALGEGTSAT
jgi:hypothetical protein